MLGNWQLLLIRIGESVLIVVLCIAAVIAIIGPLLVSLGLKGVDAPTDPNDVAELITSVFAAHWLVFVYILGVTAIVLVVVMAVHSFVIAGCARVYADAERKVASLPAPARDNMRVFTMERWLEGGKEGWWPVFWIYNAVWGIAAMIIVVPITMLAAVMLVFRETLPGAMIACGGCLGLIAFLLFLIPVFIVSAIWTQKAIIDAVARGLAAGDAMRAAWRELRTDLGRHLGVAAVMFVVTMAASMVFSGLSAMGSFGRSSSYDIMMIPLQFSSSIASSIFSAAVSAWFLACYTALAVEPRP